MSDTLDTPFVAPSDPVEFAKWIGMNPDDLAEPDDALPEAEADQADEEVADDTAPAEVEADVVDEPADDDTDADAEPADEPKAEEEPAKEVPKLPFAATAKGEAVDAALLADMTLTLKADGEEVTLPLADLVRRAQSEPAAQRRAREMESKLSHIERQARDAAQELQAVRDIALKMAQDPEYYASVVQEVESFNAPEARAQRAEEALRERDRQQQEAQARAERESRIHQFATTRIAPTLSRIVEDNPLVSQEELLGRFMADTAQWTVNGVIDPKHHDDVAEYLAGPFARFAAERNGKYAARDAQLKAETLKTQRERQAVKNQRAGASKPVGTADALNAPAKRKAPTTYKEAQASALDTLLAGLT